MPSPSRPIYESNQVSPLSVRKSSRLRKSKETFDPSAEDISRTVGDSEEVSVDPKPSHNLTIEEESIPTISSDVSAVESSAESCEADELDVTHLSEAWTKKVLFQKWTVASSKATQLKETLGVVKK